jgi:hypothetical protein
MLYCSQNTCMLFKILWVIFKNNSNKGEVHEDCKTFKEALTTILTKKIICFGNW